MTLRDAKVVWDLNGGAGEDWEKFYASGEPQDPSRPLTRDEPSLIYRTATT